MIRYSTPIASTGVALLLIAYVLRSWGYMPDDRAYASLNLIGAALSAYASHLIGFLPFVVLESAWSLAAAAQLSVALRSPPPG